MQVTSNKASAIRMPLLQTQHATQSNCYSHSSRANVIFFSSQAVSTASYHLRQFLLLFPVPHDVQVAAPQARGQVCPLAHVYVCGFCQIMYPVGNKTH